MTKDSAAWLIIKAFGVSLMFVAFVEWIDMCSQIAVYLRYVSTEEVLRAHVDSRIAEIMVIAILELVKAAGVTVASVYFLRGGRAVHRLLLREG